MVEIPFWQVLHLWINAAGELCKGDIIVASTGLHWTVCAGSYFKNICKHHPLSIMSGAWQDWRGFTARQHGKDQLRRWSSSHSRMAFQQVSSLTAQAFTIPHFPNPLLHKITSCTHLSLQWNTGETLAKAIMVSQQQWKQLPVVFPQQKEGAGGSVTSSAVPAVSSEGPELAKSLDLCRSYLQKMKKSIQNPKHQNHNYKGHLIASPITEDFSLPWSFWAQLTISCSEIKHLTAVREGQWQQQRAAGSRC